MSRRSVQWEIVLMKMNRMGSSKISRLMLFVVGWAVTGERIIRLSVKVLKINGVMSNVQ